MSRVFAQEWYKRKKKSGAKGQHMGFWADPSGTQNKSVSGKEKEVAKLYLNLLKAAVCWSWLSNK